MPKAFSENEKGWISKRLLEQGYRLFSLYGLKKTNIEDIAKAAGISKGAFYRFYESKEALFMDVIEQTEIRLRKELLAMVVQPGQTPRSRLLAIFKRAFDLFQEMPILQVQSGNDYDLLFARIPPEKLQEHLSSDQVFMTELIQRCRQAGIPITVGPEQLGSLLYPLVMGALHQDNSVQAALSGNMDMLLELVAAYCLGEVQLASAGAERPSSPTNEAVEEQE